MRQISPPATVTMLSVSSTIVSVKWGNKRNREQGADDEEGNHHDLKGRGKEKAGQMVDDPNLEAEGQAEKLAGKVQKK
jgi:uncharacterized protein YjbJ (UPF0337 family)